MGDGEAYSNTARDTMDKLIDDIEQRTAPGTPAWAMLSSGLPPRNVPPRRRQTETPAAQYGAARVLAPDRRRRPAPSSTVCAAGGSRVARPRTRTREASSACFWETSIDRATGTTGAMGAVWRGSALKSRSKRASMSSRQAAQDWHGQAEPGESRRNSGFLWGAGMNAGA